MCNPLALAVGGMVISAGQSVAQYAAQSAAADQQNALHEQNRVNSLRAFEDTQRAINDRQSQTQEAASADMFDTALDARRALSTERVAAGESGVSGLSVEHLFRDILGQQSRYNDRVSQNADWTVAQLQQEKKGAGYQAVDRINSVQKAAKPSFAATGLRIAAGGLDAVTGYRQQTK